MGLISRVSSRTYRDFLPVCGTQMSLPGRLSTMNNNAIITNGMSTRGFKRFLSSLSNSIPKFLIWLQLKIKSLNAALDSGTNFNEYISTNALDERSKQFAEKHGLLFLVYVHLEAAPNLCKREEHLLRLLDHVIQGKPDAIKGKSEISRLYLLVFKRHKSSAPKTAEELKKLCSTPSGLHSVLHSLIKCDAPDEAYRCLSWRNISEIYGPAFLSWIDKYCDDATKSQFNGLVEANEKNGLLILVDTSRSIISHLWPVDMANAPNKKKMEYFRRHYGSLPLAKYFRGGHEDLNDFLERTSGFSEQHLEDLYYLFKDTILPMIPFAKKPEKPRDSYFPTMVSILRNALVHEPYVNMFADNPSPKIKRFLSLLIPVLSRLIYTAWEKITEIYEIIRPHMPQSSAEQHGLARINLHDSVPSYRNINYEEYTAEKERQIADRVAEGLPAQKTYAQVAK